MPAGEGSPDQLYASVYGNPINEHLVSDQTEQLQRQLAQADAKGNPEEIESIQEQLRQIYEAAKEQ